MQRGTRTVGGGHISTVEGARCGGPGEEFRFYVNCDKKVKRMALILGALQTS